MKWCMVAAMAVSFLFGGMAFAQDDDFDLDALLGDASLFARADEIESSWRVTDSINTAWASGDGPPLSFYEPGSLGPDEAVALLARRNRAWTLSDGAEA